MHVQLRSKANEVLSQSQIFSQCQRDVGPCGFLFAGAKLNSARMRSTVLRGANLTLADLAGADLAGADLTDSNWWRARGLSAEQLADFTQRFPPSADVNPQREGDFLQWLEAS